MAQTAAHAHPNPTEGQQRAGNYRKGHVKAHGLDVTIENAKGSIRRGTGRREDFLLLGKTIAELQRAKSAPKTRNSALKAQ